MRLCKEMYVFKNPTGVFSGAHEEGNGCWYIEQYLHDSIKVGVTFYMSIEGSWKTQLLLQTIMQILSTLTKQERRWSWQKRLQVERNNNGKDKMVHVLILQNIESRGGSWWNKNKKFISFVGAEVEWQKKWETWCNLKRIRKRICRESEALLRWYSKRRNLNMMSSQIAVQSYYLGNKESAIRNSSYGSCWRGEERTRTDASISFLNYLTLFLTK